MANNETEAQRIINDPTITKIVVGDNIYLYDKAEFLEFSDLARRSLELKKEFSSEWQIDTEAYLRWLIKWNELTRDIDLFIETPKRGASSPDESLYV